MAKKNDIEKNENEIAIIILNWNGWRDTCECLSSLFAEANQNFQVIIIDNASTDDSVQKISAWAKGELVVPVGPLRVVERKFSLALREIKREKFEKSKENDYPERILLVKSQRNLGFAKACNVGIRYAIKKNFKYTFLLNNDTTLDNNCLASLAEFLDHHPDYQVVVPKICYYDVPDHVWCFGGKLTYLNRKKMCYENKPDKNLDHIVDSTFVSGCALFVRTAIFEQYGLLTERYFFGGEDFEFSKRMVRNNVKMAAIPHAKLYHKVGASNERIFTEDRLPYMFVGYLMRFIDKKQENLSIGYFYLWRFINLFYINIKFIVFSDYSLKRVFNFNKLLIQYSNKLDEVNESTFFKIKQII